MTSSEILSSQINQKDLTAIRAGLRQAFIRSKYKAAYLDKFKQLIPRYTAANKLHKVPWVKYQCECCKELFKSEDINVDHIEKVGAFKSVDDIKEFFFRIWCSYDNLQVLCVQCHDDKSSDERAAAAAERVRDKAGVDRAEFKETFEVDDSFKEATKTLVKEAVVDMAVKVEAISEALFPPLVLPAESLVALKEPLTIEAFADCSIDIACTKTKGMDAYIPKQFKLCGLPVYEDEDHTGPEISIVGTYGRNNESKRFIDFATHEGDPIVVLQSLIHKYIKSGMICKAIHCGSINDLEILFETEAQMEYPVETATVVDTAKPFNIADLI